MFFSIYKIETSLFVRSNRFIQLFSQVFHQIKTKKNTKKGTKVFIVGGGRVNIIMPYVFER